MYEKIQPLEANVSFGVIVPRFLFDTISNLQDVFESWVRCCIEIGIPLELPEPHFGRTLFLDIAGNIFGTPLSSLHYMNALVKHGANVHAVDYRGRGALATVLCTYSPYGDLLAYTYVTEEKLVILLEAGCDPNRTENNGSTPSDHARNTKHSRSVWTRALERTKGRRPLLAFEESLGIEAALNG